MGRHGPDCSGSGQGQVAGICEWGDMDRTVLVQDRDRWRALVNAVMNLWVLNI